MTRSRPVCFEHIGFTLTSANSSIHWTNHNLLLKWTLSGLNHVHSGGRCVCESIPCDQPAMSDRAPLVLVLAKDLYVHLLQGLRRMLSEPNSVRDRINLMAWQMCIPKEVIFPISYTREEFADVHFVTKLDISRLTSLQTCTLSRSWASRLRSTQYRTHFAL